MVQVRGGSRGGGVGIQLKLFAMFELNPKTYSGLLLLGHMVTFLGLAKVDH